MTLLLLALTIFAISANARDVDVDRQMIGFGKHKLMNFNHQGTALKKLSASYSCDNVTENWFTDAVIDNFAPIEKQQKWVGKGQRYFVNKEFWGGNNYPLFVFIGGEGEEKCTRLTSYMYMYNLAKEHRAMLIDVEHRFYGQSMPTVDDSTENLQYLSSDQALADLARIVSHLKTVYDTKESRVLTIGGSYPGNLAAWFRLKYPHVSHGSIASSAPVLAQTNFPEYMDVVAQSLIHFSGQQCYNAIEEAANIVANLALQGYGSDGMNKLQTDFQVCSNIKTDLDLSVFLSDLMGNVQGTVQYNNEHNGVLNVTDICAIMTQTGSDSYTNFVQLQKAYREANGQTCEDGNWDDTVVALTTRGAGRSWTYQTCNEFGYYQTTDSQNQPFKSWKWINLDFSRAICSAAFNGWKSDPQISWINNFYGDLNIAGTNIVFPSGTIDPWHALSVNNVTASLPQASEVKVYIEGTAHCHDLYAPANSDPASLTYARQVIATEVKKWLA